MVYLAINNRKNYKIGIKKIAKDMELPSPFLGKILYVLAKHGILTSAKGPNGGFALGKPSTQISLLDIVKIIDGMDVFNSCLLGLEICKHDPKNVAICPLHHISHPIRKDLKNLYANTNLEEIAKKLKESGAEFKL